MAVQEMPEQTDDAIKQLPPRNEGARKEWKALETEWSNRAGQEVKLVFSDSDIPDEISFFLSHHPSEGKATLLPSAVKIGNDAEVPLTLDIINRSLSSHRPDQPMESLIQTGYMEPFGLTNEQYVQIKDTKCEGGWIMENQSSSGDYPSWSDAVVGLSNVNFPTNDLSARLPNVTESLILRMREKANDWARGKYDIDVYSIAHTGWIGTSAGKNHLAYMDTRSSGIKLFAFPSQGTSDGPNFSPHLRIIREPKLKPPIPAA
jgi:hypothetical protein